MTALRTLVGVETFLIVVLSCPALHLVKVDGACSLPSLPLATSRFGPSCSTILSPGWIYILALCSLVAPESGLSHPPLAFFDNNFLLCYESTMADDQPARVSHWRLVREPALVTREIVTHDWKGEGTSEDPYLIDFIPNDPRNPVSKKLNTSSPRREAWLAAAHRRQHHPPTLYSNAMTPEH